MKLDNATQYITSSKVRFKLDSKTHRKLIDKAIKYEDNQSMLDDSIDTSDNFLNDYLRQEYNKIHYILWLRAGTKTDNKRW